MKNLSLVLALAAACAATPAFADATDSNQPPATQAPTLRIVFDCGDCKPNESIEALIEGSYLDAAKKAGISVSETQQATLKVTSYNERGSMTRVFAGVFVPPDRIEGTLTWAGGSAEVGDTARSAVNGIDVVAHNVGEEALTKITQTKPAEMADKAGSQ